MAEVYKLLVVCLQLDFLPLTTAFSAPKLSQHSVHLTVHFSSLYFMSLIMRMLWEAMLQVLYKSGQKTSAAFPSWAEPVISLHGGQALQILAACSWSPSCPLCVRKQIQEKFLHCFFRVWAKVISSAIPCILFGLFEDRSDISFLAILGNFSWSSQPFRHNHGCLTMTLVYSLISSHIRLLIFHLFKCSPTRSSSPKDESWLLQSFSLEKSGTVVIVSFLQQRHYSWKGGADFFIGMEIFS